MTYVNQCCRLYVSDQVSVAISLLMRYGQMLSPAVLACCVLRHFQANYFFGCGHVRDIKGKFRGLARAMHKHISCLSHVHMPPIVFD